MEYIIKEFGNDSMYKNNKYWFAENGNKDVIGIIEVREVGNGYSIICNIDYIQMEHKKDILELLLHKALEYLKVNNNICDIDILDNMTDIKELLEKHKFKIAYSSNINEEIRQIKYTKELK